MVSSLTGIKNENSKNFNEDAFLKNLIKKTEIETYDGSNAIFQLASFFTRYDFTHEPEPTEEHPHVLKFSSMDETAPTFALLKSFEYDFFVKLLRMQAFSHMRVILSSHAPLQTQIISSKNQVSQKFELLSKDHYVTAVFKDYYENGFQDIAVVNGLMSNSRNYIFALPLASGVANHEDKKQKLRNLFKEHEMRNKLAKINREYTPPALFLPLSGGDGFTCEELEKFWEIFDNDVFLERVAS